MSLAQRVEAFADRVEGRAPKAAADALDLVGHGEWGLAFENLLSNLHDSGVRLSEHELDPADELAREFGLGRLEVAGLRGLKRDETGRRAAVVFTLRWVSTPQRLHQLLASALGFPEFYGANWDAFWDAITGLVVMPRRIEMWGWTMFVDRMPTEGYHLLCCLLDAANESPEQAAEVVLRDDERRLDPGAERQRLVRTSER